MDKCVHSLNYIFPAVYLFNPLGTESIDMHTLAALRGSICVYAIRTLVLSDVRM